MVKAYLQIARPSANFLVGVVATTALLAAAWIGQALAHTVTSNQGVWGALQTHKAPGATGLRASQDVAIKPGEGPAPSPVIVNPLPPPQIFQQLSPQAAAALNAKIPFSTLPNPAASPFRLDTADATDRGRALDCLTMAVYYEAASESDQGEAAVAQVVLNRLRHPLFPKTVCGVVLQGANLPTGCQFTFTCDGSLGRRPTEAGWKRARRVAQRALDGYVEASVGEATHYHNQWVAPYWQPTVVKLTQIGAHIFYRWAGGMGRPIAFNGQYAGVEPSPPTIQGFTDGPALVLASPKAVVAAATAPAAAPIAVASAAPTQLAALNAPAAELAQIQTPTENQGYFGRSNGQAQRLPVSGW